MICGRVAPQPAYDPWPGNSTPRICQLPEGHEVYRPAIVRMETVAWLNNASANTKAKD
jgi:hypothetical protein